MESAKKVDDRWSHRRRVRLMASLDDGKWTPRQGAIRDISMGGVFFETGAIVPPVNSFVILGLQVQEGDRFRYYRLPAHVTHVEENGVGLKFDEFDAETVAALRSALLSAGDGEPEREDA